MKSLSEAVQHAPQDLTKAIAAAFSNYIEREERRGKSDPHPYLYASSRRKCLRRAVLEMTKPELVPAFDSNTLAKFRRGKDRERDILADLSRVGRFCDPPFEVVGQQESFKLNDRNGRLIISGKVDGRILWPWGAKWPMECKAWAPHITAGIHVFADLFNSPWTWSGAHQLLSYLFGSGEPDGILILDQPGLPKLIHVNLFENIQAMEDFIRDGEVCRDHAEAGTLPAYTDDKEECGRCPLYGSSCNPPIGGAGTQIIMDEELEDQLERHVQLKPLAKEFDRIDEQIKKRFRGTLSAMAGRFLLSGKWGSQTSYEVPEEITQKYKSVNQQGRFTLIISEVGKGT